MQHNILRTFDIVKIYFSYKDGRGLNKKELVKVRYTDQKSAYFVGKIPANYAKPKWRTKAIISVYTLDGVYFTEQIIREVNCSLEELLYKVDLPKTWNFKQLRAGTRKRISLPFKIVFADEAVIQAKTFDLSIGGFSFECEKSNLTTVQKNFPAKCSIQFPNSAIINFPDGLFEATVKYVRQKAIVDEYDKEGYQVYSFKFLKITPDERMVLKNFLLKIE